VTLPPSAESTTLRRRLEDVKRRFTNRPDSEHEQAVIRLGIASLAFIYLLLSSLKDGRFEPSELLSVGLAGSVIVFSLFVIAHIVLFPGISPARRIVGMINDISATTYCMFVVGERGAPFFVILLWVTFGNGFRFGRRYLFLSTILSTAGFSLVILTNNYWRSHIILSIGLLMGLIVLPMYVSSLLKKLTEAIARAEEANRAKSRFIANMSHEMRTPLNGILGMVDLLRETPLNFEQRDFVRTVHASACALLSLVEDVLDISRIEAGKIAIEKADFDLHELIKGTASILAPQAHAKELKLSTQVPPHIPFLLKGDSIHLRQVILNLLSNAIKFTEKGEVCLRAVLMNEAENAITLKIEVADTGIGIAPEALARIFDRFTQADESITRRFGGTGLGTTIAKDLVELMGGRIGVSSELGTGSTFWLTVDLEKQPAQSIQAAERSNLSESRILLIASDAMASRQILDHLSSWGIASVEAADRSAQAFAHLVSAESRNEPYHIAIVVGQGLDMEPFAFAKAVKSDRTIRSIQLILATRNESELDLDAITSQGFSAAIRVPADKTMLFNALHFIRPGDAGREGIANIANRYHRKIGEWRGLNVLVAEDNPTNQKVIAKILERAGYEAHLVDNGEEALDALEDRSFDLIVMDINMPVMGGLEAAKLYRFMQRQEPRTPIIALTADATPETRKACEEAGIDACIIKPIEAWKLLETIVSVIPGREAHAEAAPASSLTDRAKEPKRDGEARILDPDTFRELEALGNGTDFLEDLTKVFLEDGEKLLREMERALGNQNAGEMHDLAHALRGSAGNIGAVSLVDSCAKISRTGLADFKAVGPMRLEEIRDEFAKVKSALSRHAKGHSRAIS
jgi:two-component system, sensor histidine kinase RpfC